MRVHNMKVVLSDHSIKRLVENKVKLKEITTILELNPILRSMEGFKLAYKSKTLSFVVGVQDNDIVLVTVMGKMMITNDYDFDLKGKEVAI